MNRIAAKTFMKTKTSYHKIELSKLKINAINVFKLNEHLSALIFFDGKNVKVTTDLCPHMGGPLSQSLYCSKTKTLRCPWHGYQFSAENLTLVENPNEKTWTKPLAANELETFKTPKYRIEEIPYQMEGDFVIFESDLT